MNQDDLGAATRTIPPSPPPLPPSFGEMIETQVKPIVDLNKAVNSEKNSGKRHSPVLPVAAAIGAILVVFCSLAIYLIKENRAAASKNMPAASAPSRPVESVKP